MQNLLSLKQEVITSSGNNTVKQVKGLLLKKNRDKSGQFIVEGSKQVLEALSSDFLIDSIIFSESSLDIIDSLMPPALEKGIRCLMTTDNVFKTITDTQTPQGVLAVINKRQYDLEMVISKKKSFLAILDGIKDPGNLGTIIRTLDAAGGDGAILLNDCVDPYNPKSVRSTMGSIFRLPFFEEADSSSLLTTLGSNGYHIATSHLMGENIFDWQSDSVKIALVIGSESHGVSKEMVEHADSLIKIPMIGGAESLNASVAAGIMIYEFFRKGMKVDE